MNKFDLHFKENLLNILQQEWTVDNRATWKDGSPVMTKRIFGVVNRYDLSKELPVTTLRKTPIKSCFREIDWIHRKRSNKIDDLGLSIWDDWQDENKTIGKGYGYQVAKPVFGYDNQMDFILDELDRNPTSRRLIIEMWNVDDLNDMTLTPCAHHLQFWSDGKKLNLLLKQRSNDMLVANCFNAFEYTLMTHMVAIHAGLDVGELVHIIGDMHIYNKHEDQAWELLKRPIYKQPELMINPNKRDFYRFTEDDFILADYKHGENMNFEVAI
ncbi:thymidylate synthase [Priestia megaterium]